MRKLLFDFSFLSSLDLDNFLNSALVGCSDMVFIVVRCLLGVSNPASVWSRTNGCSPDFVLHNRFLFFIAWVFGSRSGLSSSSFCSQSVFLPFSFSSVEQHPVPFLFGFFFAVDLLWLQSVPGLSQHRLELAASPVFHELNALDRFSRA
jgi:hypothetical protein